MRVFIAHADVDKPKALAIAEKLRGAGVQVFLDEDSLPPGQDYNDRIRRAINRCHIFVFLVSPASQEQGRFVQTELRYVRERWPSPRRRVLPVMVVETAISQIHPYLTQTVTILRAKGDLVSEVKDEVLRMRSVQVRHHPAWIAGTATVVAISVASVRMVACGSNAETDVPREACLQVNKDNSVPLPPSVVVAGIDSTPYVIPPSSPNRFDVLANGVPTVAADGFTDAFDSTVGPNTTAINRSFRDRSWIEATYGKGTASERECHEHAILRCINPTGTGLEALCHALRFEKPVQASAVVAKGRRLLVLNGAQPGTLLDLSESVPGQDGEQLDVCVETKPELSHTLLSFVHLSDIHLRDPSLTVLEQRRRIQVNWFNLLSSFDYKKYVDEAIFASVGAEGEPNPADRPRFVIHTGDSIDVGTVSELDSVHTLIDRSRIPFYELFGNHDVLVFGNLLPTATHDKDGACAPISTVLGTRDAFVPAKVCVDQLVRCQNCVGSEADLVARPTQSITRDVFMKHFTHDRADQIPQPPPMGGQGFYCPDPKVRWDGYSRAHGFDLNTVDGRLDGPKLGYYAFVVPLLGLDQSAVFIGLNSEDLADGQGGTRGRIGRAQLTWLEGVLACVKDRHPRDLVFVFAHQPLSQIDVEHPMSASDQSLATVLSAHSNVVGYFYGQGHKHAICRDDRKDVCSHFWEVGTASLIEFPQEGRLVRIKQVSDDLAFLELTAFRERLANQGTEFARYVTLGRRMAERDFCHAHRESPGVKCGADERPFRGDGRDANSRLFFRLP
jgi:hypothetical protein